MPKFFVVSDVHSFYAPLKKALDEAGFDPNNENHWLVTCGDNFDRGPESEEVLHFLMQLERKILIRGNHDDLLEECCMREFPFRHDASNRTKKTIEDIGGAGYGRPFDECCRITWNKTQAYRDQLVNYFETKNYIFVHGWIPCEVYYHGEGEDRQWYQSKKTYEYKPDWRECNDVEWESARWINGIKRAYEGIIEPGKTIICGHWHCSYGHMLDSIKTDSWISEFEKDAIWSPWYHEGCIAIDRCTAHTGKVNVLVLEHEFLEGNDGNN
jgi:predicted phosphodiesterase